MLWGESAIVSAPNMWADSQGRQAGTGSARQAATRG